MKNNRKLPIAQESVLQKCIDLQKNIITHPKRFSGKKIYIKILSKMQKVLSVSPLDQNQLKKHEFGLYRTVTDGPMDKDIEQDILSFLEVIYDLHQTLN